MALSGATQGKLAIAGAVVVGFGLMYVMDRRAESSAREGPAVEAELACAFELAPSVVLRETGSGSLGKSSSGQSTSLTRHRVTWVDAKTGQRLARVSFAPPGGQLVGCDDLAAWVLDEKGELVAYGPKGERLGDTTSLLAKGGKPALPLQLGEARVHLAGGVLVRGDDASLWRATVDGFVSMPTGDVFPPPPARVKRPYSGARFYEGMHVYELHGDPLVTLRYDGQAVALPAPFEQGFIRGEQLEVLPKTPLVIAAASLS
ncbi:MAG: hypothetical protein JNK82_24135, partial [Myxococcaceae bacterium]|nr:hypothetical protein [Myxococcaceae bacterium]